MSTPQGPHGSKRGAGFPTDKREMLCTLTHKPLAIHQYFDGAVLALVARRQPQEVLNGSLIFVNLDHLGTLGKVLMTEKLPSRSGTHSA